MNKIDFLFLIQLHILKSEKIRAYITYYAEKILLEEYWRN